MRRSRSSMNAESLPVWLLREPPPDIRGDLGQLALVARELRPERGPSRPADAVAAMVWDSRWTTASYPRSTWSAWMRKRLAGDGRGDVGVAVPVAADPGAPLHERRSCAVAGCPSCPCRGRRRRPRRGPGPSERSSDRYSRGVTTNSDSSKNAMALRTSSRGVGACTRSGEVCHRRLIASRSRRRISASSVGVRRGSSSSSSSR